MIIFDETKLYERREEFIKFEGWLPMGFLESQYASERWEYLKSIGKDKELYQAYRTWEWIYKKCCKNPREDHEDFVREFIKLNPQFADVVSFKDDHKGGVCYSNRIPLPDLEELIIEDGIVYELYSDGTKFQIVPPLKNIDTRGHHYI